MRYVRKVDEARAFRVAARDFGACGSIHKSGSVRGMCARFGWQPGGQVRVGSFVYNVGRSGLDKLRAAGLLRGE